MPIVHVPPVHRGPTQGEARIEVSGATVRACIEEVGSRYLGFREQIFDASDEVHRFVKLGLNGDELDRDALDTPVGANDVIEIIAAVSGG